ncbi:MAG: hypothetical protein A3I11_06330 [Elusimicrobia bacterium RIFCSPLOWO2_02_FULL_39_32]|nr:MAG: hypothetical protein A3B80_08940 [Elusimicrobia bacterium RIFCSPHIGHO2_02_FULL_39_36]OGR91737.1 MAG: hypothetical protein A3I11_06330 [Elusimicrobia bacterium RIFCSPLOWO2_02_FULL_39_32]OGR98395.1 MAG: hypothetical protein A3G85_02185 [Elusimicrobia bacterium RIFCSPLOWO2_12_FULL_39_28]
MRFYLLHPIAVHFPIALLIFGFIAEVFSLILKNNNTLLREEGIQTKENREEKWNWLLPSAEWSLWLGTISVWVTVGLGLLAEETAPHISAAWEVLAEHETLGLWTAGLFSALSILRFFFRNQWRTTKKIWRWVFIFLWLGAISVLIATAFHGGELVFNFGIGVKK